ncbi:MAG: hypothetical protein ACE5G9_07150 [Nitrospinales bacterium]
MVKKAIGVKRLWFAGCCLMLIPGFLAFPLGAQGKEEPEIGPPDVFAHVALMREELDLVRRYMGKPRDERPEIKVRNAAPREVFFQALTLFRKADQLCFELTRRRAVMRSFPASEIRASHVFVLVRAALKCLRLIKKELGINEIRTVPARDPAKTPTDVFRLIVQVNRQLNLLLIRRFSPSDVYQQVTQAINYAAFLLRRFPDVRTRIPAAPAFESGKFPADVYLRLIKCFGLIQEIAHRSGLTMLEREETEEDLTRINPGDDYNMASLIVSELAYINRKAGNTAPPESYFPGLKFSSHVYQRVGILEIQLSELLKQVKAQPNWLSG